MVVAAVKVGFVGELRDLLTSLLSCGAAVSGGLEELVSVAWLGSDVTASGRSCSSGKLFVLEMVAK